MTMKRLVPLLITILISQAGCANRSAQVSQEGRIYCKQNYPTIAFSAREETAQSDFQKCLDTIDQELAKNRERLESKALENQHANQIRLLQRMKELAPPDSRLFYCRTHMQDVIDAENERARLLPARVRAYKDSSLSDAEREIRFSSRLPWLWRV